MIRPCHAPSHSHRERVRICHARIFRALQLLNAGNFCVHTLSMDSDGVQPAWARGLKRSGLYYMKDSLTT